MVLVVVGEIGVQIPGDGVIDLGFTAFCWNIDYPGISSAYPFRGIRNQPLGTSTSSIKQLVWSDTNRVLQFCGRAGFTPKPNHSAGVLVLATPKV